MNRHEVALSSTMRTLGIFAMHMYNFLVIGLYSGLYQIRLKRNDLGTESPPGSLATKPRQGRPLDPLLLTIQPDSVLYQIRLKRNDLGTESPPGSLATKPRQGRPLDPLLLTIQPDLVLYQIRLKRNDLGTESPPGSLATKPRQGATAP